MDRRLFARSSSDMKASVQARLQSIGLSERRATRSGDVSSEPVLVIRRRWFVQEVFDQDGRLLVMGTVPARPGLSRVLHLFSHEPWTFSTPGGHAVMTVSPDRSQDPKEFIVADADGREIGSVVAKGRHKGSIYADGQVIGRLVRRGTGRVGLTRLLRRGGPDVIHDAIGTEVGRVWYVASGLGWMVIDVDPQLAQPLRRLLLAVADVIREWRAGGGG